MGFELTHAVDALGQGIYLDDFAGPLDAFVANCIVSGNHASYIGGGIILVGDVSLELVNTIIANNSAVNDGGGLANFGGEVNALHSTFWNNSVSYNGRSLYNSGIGTIDVSRSILWSNFSGFNEVAGDTGPISIIESIVRGGYSGTGNLSTDPALTYHGFEQSTSISRSQLPSLDAIPLDVDRESRGTDAFADIGADEFIDTDGDDLPDHWELWLIGLDANDAAQSLADVDDGSDLDWDGLIDLDEYLAGTNPAVIDTDDDGIGDTLELHLGLNPFVDNSTTDSDGDGYSDMQEVYRDTDPLSPQAPHAVSQTLHINQGGLLKIGFLVVGGDPASNQLEIVTNPSDGQLSQDGEGHYEYQPDEGFSGWDRIEFRYASGALTGNTAAISIHVNSAEEFPDFSPGASFSATVGETAGFGGHTGVNTDSTRWVQVSGPQTGATITDPLDFNSEVVFTTAGSYSFKLLATNGEVVANKPVSVEVNDANTGFEGSTVNASPMTTYVGQTVDLSTQLASGAPAPTKIEYYHEGVVLAETTGVSAISWAPQQAGAYHISARLYNGSDTSAFSDPVTVTVNQTEFVPPEKIYPGYNALEPTSNDLDGDGWTDAVEFYARTSPLKADGDDDGVDDSLDGFANDNTFSPPRVPESRYIVVEIGEGNPIDMNNNTEILLEFGRSGEFLQGSGYKYWKDFQTSNLGLFDQLNGINIHGDIVGARFVKHDYGEDDGYHLHGYKISSNGGSRQRLANTGPHGPNVITPDAINDGGNIVGEESIWQPQGGIDQCTALGKNGSWSSVPNYLPSGNGNIINESGSVLLRNASGSIHRTVADVRSGFTFFGASLNEGESFCGGKWITPSLGNKGFAARFGRPGKTTEIIPPLPVPYSFLDEINNHHVAVGGMAHIETDGNSYWTAGHNAIIYRNSVARDLNDLIDVPEDEELHLYWADEINDAGVIAARAYRKGKDIAVLLLPVEIVPDFNRDGVIDDKDRGKVTEDKPWRWWLNDDNDEGDFGGDDYPESGSNGIDSTVNGVRDLVDFFPLYFDFKQIVTVLPPESCEYRLVHEGAGLNFIYTDLTIDDVRKQHHDQTIAEELKDAQINKIFANGLTKLSNSFLNKIKNEAGKGVLLVEAGFMAFDKPLVVEVWKDGNRLAEIDFHIETSSVEEMYRRVNLRNANPSAGLDASGGFSTDTGEPANYPDDLASNKWFAFVHGFNVDAEQGRGWNAEVFKRMHQLGSRAKFIAIQWYGDTGGPGYHIAVENALKTSQLLPGSLSFASGDLTVAAHSLGNMLASNAIAHEGLSASRYYMINAAVPMEAYDSSESHDGPSTTSGKRIVRDDWKAYWTATLDQRRVYSSHWYQLFNPANDNRANLKWGDRFSSVNSIAYNFYSSGEDVVDNAGTSETVVSNYATIIGCWLWTKVTGDRGSGTHAWTTQEIVKGSTLITSTRQAGWGFASGVALGYVGDANFNPMPPSQTNDTSVTDEEIAQFGLFYGFNNTDLHGPIDDANALPVVTRTQAAASALLDQGTAAGKDLMFELLASGIPSRSYAAAANEVERLNDFGNRNFNMASSDMHDGWPSDIDSGDGGMRWRHSDFKDIALRYVYPVYDKMIEIGELNQ